jgi:hypothetical protein
MPGGPVLTPVIPGEVKSGTLYLSAYGHNIPLATVPGDIADLNKHGMVFIASNREYLLCYRTVTMEEYQRRDVPNPATIYAFDRAANRWTTFTVEGNASNGKLFGAWLGLRVGIDNWDRKVSPGREAERSTDSALLPSVRRLYEANIAAIDRVTTPSYRVPGQYLPGILILRNLSDGRVIRIVTEHEDSEILFADDHAVIYRVDDSIYQAPIDGNQLGKSTVVAHGDDVPEIHWSFWGKGDTN